MASVPAPQTQASHLLRSVFAFGKAGEVKCPEAGQILELFA